MYSLLSKVTDHHYHPHGCVLFTEFTLLIVSTPSYTLLTHPRTHPRTTLLTPFLTLTPSHNRCITTPRAARYSP